MDQNDFNMENSDEISKLDNAKKMGEMPIGKLIFHMAWPAILSMFIQAFYNVVDSFFVSMISEEALAAVTYIFPVQMLLISVSVGTGVGINSLIARRLGARRYEEANLAASHGYRLSFFNWIFFALIGIFLSGPMMHLMSDTPYIVENGEKYMFIITVGSLFSIVQITTEKILQSTGNMKIPMVCSICGAVTNIIMDPVMIFGYGPFPEMGVTGAAVATVLGQLVSMCLGQYFLFAKEHAVHVKLRGWKMQGRILRDIYAVGAPAILMQSISSVMQFGMNLILGGLSETAVAVMGVYGRLQSFIFMPVFGLNQGVLPVMGFNYGARSGKRLMEAYKKGLTTALVIMAAGFVMFQLIPHQMIAIFNSTGNQAMYDIGEPALKTISLCFLPAAFGIMTSSVFQAIGHGFLSLWGSLLRQLIGILPLAWILAYISGLDLVWYSFPLAELIGVVYFAVTFKHVYRTDIRRLDIIKDVM